ncbi:MAG: hypothetical protein ACLUDU_03330 [Butyricimonas faecihominis]
MKDFTGGDVMVIYYVGQEMKVDTLQVSDAGVFVYDVKIDEPSRAFLVFENYGCSMDLFLKTEWTRTLTFLSIPKNMKRVIFMFRMLPTREIMPIAIIS